MGPDDLERLLTDDAWLRRMARQLARDPAAADDLVQETWAVALGAPAAARSRRAWLAGTLRNLWKELARGEQRRAERERAAARPEARGPSTDEIVATLSLRRAVVDALLELDEPERGVLYRRFFEGASLTRIARDGGVAVSTVHARLARGLERLRALLDRSRGGRGAWLPAMLAIPATRTVPFAAAKGALGSALLGGLAVGTATKLGIATAALTAGALAVWVGTTAGDGIGREHDLRVEPAEAGRGLQASDARATDPLEAAGGGSARLPAPPSPALEAPAAVAPAPRPRVGGRLIDERGAPLAGIELRLSPAGLERAQDLGARTGADGGFEIALPADFRPEHCTPAAWRIDDERLTLLLATRAPIGEAGAAELEEELDPLLLVAAPRARFAGMVVDPRGVPVAGVTLDCRLGDALFRDLGVRQSGELHFAGWSARSRADGRFELEAAASAYLELDAREPGHEDASVALPPHDALDLTITLRPRSGSLRISGTVLGPDGRPIEGASVSLGSALTRSDAAGAFQLVWDPRHPRDPVYVRSPEGVWRPTAHETHLCALARGLAPARVAMTSELAAEPIVLRLGAAPLAIVGRVVDASGAPVPDAVVWIADPTPFARPRVGSGEDAVPVSMGLEEQVSGRRGAFADARGAFRLEGLVEREYQVQAFDPRSASYGPGWTVAAGTQGLELRLLREASARRVAGRVLAPDGTPQAGIRVRPLRRWPGGFGAQPPATRHGSVVSDADGRFAFAEIAVADTTLELSGEQVFLHHVELEGQVALDELELVVPRLCELQLGLRDPSAADALAVLDGGGRALDLLEEQGEVISLAPRAELVEGRSRVLRVPETARELRLFLGDAEVARIELRLDPRERTVLDL